MSWSLFRTRTFLRTARIFFRKHPNLLPEFKDLVQQLVDNPFAPRLRLHALRGPHRGKKAVLLSYSTRVVLVLKVSEKEIYLLDIGTHEEVCR